MKAVLPAVLLCLAILLMVPACQQTAQNQDKISAAADTVRAFAESQNPELKDQPLMVTVSKRQKGGGGANGEPCICLIVCSSHGTCTGCACSPAKCGTCAAASELAPVDAVFTNAIEMNK